MPKSIGVPIRETKQIQAGVYLWDVENQEYLNPGGFWGDEISVTPGDILTYRMTARFTKPRICNKRKLEQEDA